MINKFVHLNNINNFEIAFWVMLVVFILWVFIFSIPWKTIKNRIKNLQEKVKTRTFSSNDDILEIYKAIEILKKDNKGGTVIIERDINLDDFISEPVSLNATLSWELIVTIFVSNRSPLHDGVIIIRNHKIKYASSYINFLSSNSELPNEFGTRHRSAIGITEKTDAIAIVLSEETGNITISKNGKYEQVGITKFTNQLNEYIKTK